MVDYQNGKIPASLLRPVSNFRPLNSRVNENLGSNLLREDAWAALNMLQAAFYRAHGRSLNVSEAYRGLTLQTAYWQEYQAGVGNLAARPGTSNHGWAISLDLGSTTYGTATKIWLDANAPRFGWWPTGNGFSPREGWHYDFRPGTATEIIPADGGLIIIDGGDTMTPEQDARLKNIEALLATENGGGIRARIGEVKATLDNTEKIAAATRDKVVNVEAIVDDARATTRNVETILARETYDGLPGGLRSALQDARARLAVVQHILVTEPGGGIKGAVQAVKTKLGA